LKVHLRDAATAVRASNRVLGVLVTVATLIGRAI